MAIPNKINKTPTTINAIHKILVNSKSKLDVVTVDDSVEEFVLDVFVPAVFVLVLEILVLVVLVFELVLVPVVFMFTAAKV